MATFPQAELMEKFPATFAGEPSGTMTAVPSLPIRQLTAANDRVPGVGVLTKSTANKPSELKTVRQEVEVFQASGGFDFFEDFHVVPRSFDLGNVLSSQSIAIEVFSGFRREVKEWTSFTNNAGAGVELGGIPTLPTDVQPLNSVDMTLDVDATGDPIVDTTLDFFFTGVGTAVVPIEIQRIVLWGLTPELPYTEELRSLTDIKPAKAGKEQRASIRKNPRQAWFYNYLPLEGEEAQVLENLMFDFHSRNFGVPVWFEDTEATAAIAVDDLTITVVSTEFRNFQVDGFAVIVTSQSVFDALQIESLTTTTLTFTSASLNDYPIGTRVYPLAICRTTAVISGSRFPVGLKTLQLQFISTSNDLADLADLSAFSSYNGKLLLDNGNSMLRGNVRQAFRGNLVTIDGDAGLVAQGTSWGRDKREHIFTLRAEGRQAIWEMRGLIHALRGRAISFYIPRDSDDLTAAADLLDASNTIDVDNVGYATFVRHRAPKNVIRINFVDGSTPILREVIDSAVSSPTVDILTVDSNWPTTITVAEISRIDYVEEVRLDSDNVRIEYDASGHRARMVSPIISLF